MKDMLDRLHWPQVAALAIAVAGLVLALIFVPAATWAAIPWQAITAAIVSIGAGGASALLGPLVRPTETPPSRPTLRDDTRGSMHVDALLAVLSLAALAWAALRAYAPHVLAWVWLGVAMMVVSGCGVPAIRAHASTVHVLHETLATVGDEVRATTATQLAACPHDDGDERAACIDRIERLATAVAAVHDAMIAPVDAYRAAVLRACGVDPSDPSAEAPPDCPDPPPDVLDEVLAVAPGAIHDLPALVAAMRALDVPVPAELVAILGGL